MRLLSRLNSIAARIAIAIIFSVILTLLVLIGLSLSLNHFRKDYAARSRVVISRSNFAVINPRGNGMVLSGKIAVIIRSVASAPQAEQQRIVAAISDPEMEVGLDAPPRSGIAGRSDG